MNQSEIVVIAGPMFAGKSDALVRRLEEAHAGSWEFAVFKPKFDTRTTNEIRSRRGGSFPATPVDNPEDILNHLGDERIVCIDEAHMFNDDIVDVVREINRRGKYVIVSGCEITWRGAPFTQMAGLLAIATEVVKLRATCNKCKRIRSATRSQRMTNDEADVVIGDAGMYEARCLDCFDEPA